MLPLQGITVVSIEQAVAAPFASRQLADLGARVIKVERPGGGDFARDYDHVVKGLSSHFVWLNHSKESVALDLKRPLAVEAVRRLIAGADVFIQNLAPGAVERLGLAPSELRASHPRLITCSISGYGSTGPYRDKRAYDLLVQCEAGVVSVTGTPETPAKSGVAMADLSSGTYAFSAVLAALFQRERTGAGATIEVSLLDSLVEWMGFHLLYTEHSGQQPSRVGASHPIIAPYGPHRVADGVVFIGVQNEREWARLCAEVLDEPDLATDPRYDRMERRVEHRPELTARIEARLAALTTAEVMARLDRANIACARLNQVREVLDHPQLAARGRWQMVETPVGPVRVARPAITIQGVTHRIGRVPEVGEHTSAVLAEVGFGPEEIAELVAGADPS